MATTLTRTNIGHDAHVAALDLTESARAAADEIAAAPTGMDYLHAGMELVATLPGIDEYITYVSVHGDGLVSLFPGREQFHPLLRYLQDIGARTGDVGGGGAAFQVGMLRVNVHTTLLDEQ